MDWFRRRRIDRVFFIWLALLVPIYPILIGVFALAGMTPGDGDANSVIGYSLLIFVVGSGVSVLYLAGIGLPIILLVWLVLFPLMRRLGLSPRTCAILTASIASCAAMIPAAIRLGGDSLPDLLGITLALGLVPCLVSIVYFAIARRGAVRQDQR